MLYPKKPPPNQKTQQLAHTLPYNYRDFLSAIFAANLKMFQENHGFLSHNTENTYNREY